MRESGDVSLKRDSERERAAVDGSGRAQERYMAMSRLEEHCKCCCYISASRETVRWYERQLITHMPSASK